MESIDISHKDRLKQKYAPHQSNLLGVLHEIQNHSPRNFISSENMAWVANYLGITLASVYGVVKYYSMFSTSPRGRHIIRICKSPVCRMLANGNVAYSLSIVLKVATGEVTPDGLFSVEHAECLGHCDQAPAMMIDEKVYGPLTHKKITRIITSISRHYGGK